MQLFERPGETILNQIVRPGGIARQRVRVAPQARDLGFDAAINFRHGNPLPPRPARRPIQDERELIGRL